MTCTEARFRVAEELGKDIESVDWFRHKVVLMMLEDINKKLNSIETSVHQIELEVLKNDT